MTDFSLPIDRETLAAAYDFLRVTPPFYRWKLPKSHEVKFKLSRSRTEYGRYQWDGKQHTITASVHAIGHTLTLIRFMAHEMIHLRLESIGKESKRGGLDTHNAFFRRLAARVCRYHGFDPKAFY